MRIMVHKLLYQNWHIVRKTFIPTTASYHTKPNTSPELKNTDIWNIRSGRWQHPASPHTSP